MAAGTPTQAPVPLNWQLAAKSGLRAIFGIVWAINAPIWSTAEGFSGQYADGDPVQALTGMSTYEMAPGQGLVYDLTIPAPGQ